MKLTWGWFPALQEEKSLLGLREMPREGSGGKEQKQETMSEACISPSCRFNPKGAEARKRDPRREAQSRGPVPCSP